MEKVGLSVVVHEGVTYLLLTSYLLIMLKYLKKFMKIFLHTSVVVMVVCAHTHKTPHYDAFWTQLKPRIMYTRTLS